MDEHVRLELVVDARRGDDLLRTAAVEPVERRQQHHAGDQAATRAADDHVSAR